MAAAIREDRFKYGMPLFCAEWLSSKFFLVGGGGGSAATGIKNRVLLAKYEAGSVSDQLAEVEFASQTPVRSAVHPGGNDVIVAFTDRGIHHLRIALHPTSPSIDRVTDSPALDAFEGVRDETLCLLFTRDGRFFAAGSAGGWIQIWQWPEMHVRMKFREDAVYTALKDVDVTAEVEPMFLAVTTGGGTAELWDFNSGSQCYEFPLAGSGVDRFAHCKFLPVVSKSHLLFTTAISGKRSYVLKWQILKQGMVKLLKKVRVGSESTSAFAVSGRVMAVGTTEGNIKILTTQRMLVMQSVPNAHMVFISSIRFAPTSESISPAEVLSVSGDASAKVTTIRYKNETGLWFKQMVPYLLFNLILVLIALYLLFTSEGIVLSSWSPGRSDEL